MEQTAARRLCSSVMAVVLALGCALPTYASAVEPEGADGVGGQAEALAESGQEALKGAPSEETARSGVDEGDPVSDGEGSTPAVLRAIVVDPVEPGVSSADAVSVHRFHGADAQVVSTQRVKQGDTLYAPASPERSGFVFRGWSSDEDGAVELEPFASSVVEDEQVSGAVHEWWPVFEEKRFVFFMHPNGSVLQTKEAVAGDVVTTSDVSFSVDSEHRVEGWYADEALTQRVDALTLADADVVLWAKVDEGHWIDFAYTQGATYFEPQFVAPGDASVDPGAPARKGYSFQGWSTVEGSAAADFAFGSELTESITLHAIWKPELTTYAVRVMKQSASDLAGIADEDKTYEEAGFYGIYDAMSEDSVASADLATALSYEGFSRNAGRDASYTVAGDGSTTVDVFFDRMEVTYSFWRMAADDEGVQYGENAATESASQLFVVTRSDDGTWRRGDGSEYQGTRYVEGERLTGLFGQSFEASGQTVPPLVVEVDGGHRCFYNGTSFYTNLTIYGHLESLEDGVVYLKERLNAAVFRNALRHYEQWDGTERTDPYSTPASGIRYSHAPNVERWVTAYSPDGGATKVDLGREPGVTVRVPLSTAVTTHVYYTLNSYQLEFFNYNAIAQAGMVKATTPLTEYASYVPERPAGIPDGFGFQGWYADEGLTKPVDFSVLTMPTENATYYAKWAAPVYTVTVHMDEDPDGPVQTMEVGYLEAIDKGALNEIFASEKWAERDADGDLVIFNLETLLERDVELYPVNVDELTSYRVTYDMDGGTGSVADGKTYLRLARAQVLSAQGATKDGKPFLKWTAGPLSYYPGSHLTMVGDITLKAVYGENPSPVTLTYRANGGFGADHTITGIANHDTVSAATLAEAGFSRPGYLFKGWSTDPRGAENLIAAGDGVTVDDEGDNILYAIWEADPAWPGDAGDDDGPASGSDDARSSDASSKLPGTGDQNPFAVIALGGIASLVLLAGNGLIGYFVRQRRRR